MYRLRSGVRFEELVLFIGLMFTVLGTRVPVGNSRKLNLAYLVTGCATILLGALLLYRGYIRSLTKPEIFGAVFVGYYLISGVLYSPTPVLSTQYAALILFWLSVSYLITIRRTPLKLTQVLLWVSRATILYIVISATVHLITGEGRFTGLAGGNANSLTIVSIWTVVIVVLLRGARRITSIEFYASSLILAGTIAYSGSRAGAATLLVAAISLRRMKLISLSSLVKLAAVAIIGGILGSTAFALLDPEAFEITAAKWGNALGLLEYEREVPRTRHLELAVEALGDSGMSLWFGRGLESYASYRAVAADYIGVSKVLHSSHLQFLVGGGLVGFLLYGLFLGSLWTSSKSVEDFQLGAGCRVLLLCGVFYGLFHPQIVSRILFFIVPTMMAVGLKGYRLASERNPRRALLSSVKRVSNR